MSYLALKHLHVTCVALSAAGFVLRGVWMMLDSSRLKARWVRITPHAVDSVLLGSAIGLAVWSGQYPLQQGWLTAKVVGLLAYIGLGTIALKRGPSLRVRAVAWCAALATLGYIVSVALLRDARGFLSLFGA